MIAAFIEWISDYEYDYKFHAMCDGVSFPIYEVIFLYLVFFLDVFILITSSLSVLILTAFSIAWICGAL
mgnify:FL=1